MESVQAFVRALKAYLAIGLVVSAVNAVAFQAPPGETSLARAVVVLEDVVLWPRFLVLAASSVDGRLATLPREDQPVLYSLMRGSLAELWGTP